MDLSLPQIWLIVGLIMLILELASVFLVFVFFSVGALITALLAYIGLLPGLELQILTFSAISLVSMMLLRKHTKRLFDSKEKNSVYNEFIGETALVVKDIPPAAEGKIYYRGAEWKATAADHAAIIAGSKVIIVKTEGIVLVVEES